MWRKAEKLQFLATNDVPWRTIEPDNAYTWLVPGHAVEFGESVPIEGLFDLYTAGLKTNRDQVAYDWDVAKLSYRIQTFIAAYNAEVHRHKAQRDADWPSLVNWSRDLKQDALRGRIAQFEESKIRLSLYRPFAKRWLFFDRILNEEVYQWPKIGGRVICASGVGAEKPFAAFAADSVTDLNFFGGGSVPKWFPLSHLKDEALIQFRQRYTDDSITKEAIFHYIYALLHHTEYRERYSANLKRELPRIPFAPDFHSFAVAGKELARLHVGYESLEPWPLDRIETKGVPYSERVTKMKLAQDKQSLWVNASLTLAAIPPETFDYRLGSRSALDWIIDQYQIKGQSDPNREDDPGYIIRLIGQVVRVSIETQRIVKSLPAFRN
jgi:predicted helicase